jgi:two-component system chemotaxis response regulator CheY
MPLDVLIVDDSAAIRKILQRVLRQTDLPLGTIWEASDGQEGMQMLAANRVGLIFSDINMPTMNGIEMLAKIKSNSTLNTIPIIMITTEGSQEKVMQALKLGASGYVRKPFTPDQIKDKLAGLVS